MKETQDEMLWRANKGKFLKRTLAKWGHPRYLTNWEDNKCECVRRGEPNSPTSSKYLLCGMLHFIFKATFQDRWQYILLKIREKTKVPWGWAMSYCVYLVPGGVPSTDLFKEWTFLQFCNSLPGTNWTGYSQTHIWFGGQGSALGTQQAYFLGHIPGFHAVISTH